MEVALTEWIAITDQSSVGEARRAALLVGHRLGFDETRAAELALLVTEVSRNALIHGGGGQVILAGVKDGEDSAARILAIDTGPGISNLAGALNDGYSTAGTMGNGLGAMRRIASGFEVFTGPGGTIVLLELGPEPATGNLQVAGITVPYPGERVCGDAWTCQRTPQRTVALLADGLGHGWGAAEAAQEALTTFHRYAELSPAAILGYVHDSLKKTRGAVAAVAAIQPQTGTMSYAGVGNISGVLLQGLSSRSLMSHNGTLGATAPRIQELQFPWSTDSTLVLHSDGLHTRWDLAAYSGLTARHPAIIGGALLRDFRRQRDDASVVVIKAA
jgi:anti-sigma regulatory factor (Ser/Thr protein kinase)